MRPPQAGSAFGTCHVAFRRRASFAAATASPRSVSSRRITGSAPSGTRAPVNTRVASPAPTARVGVAPAAIASDDAQRHRHVRRRAADIGASHGVSVHRRVGPRRQRNRRDDVLGEHVAECIRQWKTQGWLRCHGSEHGGDSVSDAERGGQSLTFTPDVAAQYRCPGRCSSTISKPMRMLGKPFQTVRLGGSSPCWLVGPVRTGASARFPGLRRGADIRSVMPWRCRTRAWPWVAADSNGCRYKSCTHSPQTGRTRS